MKDRNISPRQAQAAVAPGLSIVAAAGPASVERFWEFFAATLRNRNTRRAHLRAVTDFCLFLEARGVSPF